MTEFRKMSPVYEEGDAPPTKKRPGGSLTFLILLGSFGLCVVLIAAGAAVFLPAISQARRDSARAHCARNVGRLASATLLYAADHNDRLPPAENWSRMAPAYLGGRGEFLLRCPEARRQGHGRYGIAFNVDLGSEVVAKLEDARNLPLIFDSSAPGRGPAAKIDTLPRPGRHMMEQRGNNIAFADGSVRFVLDGAKR